MICNTSIMPTDITFINVVYSYVDSNAYNLKAMRVLVHKFPVDYSTFLFCTGSGSLICIFMNYFTGVITVSDLITAL